jgi:hypothetical protein
MLYYEYESSLEEPQNGIQQVLPNFLFDKLIKNILSNKKEHLSKTLKR